MCILVDNLCGAEQPLFCFSFTLNATVRCFWLKTNEVVDQIYMFLYMLYIFEL